MSQGEQYDASGVPYYPHDSPLQHALPVSLYP